MSTHRQTSLSVAELIGDLCSPEGSERWCVGMRHEIQTYLDESESSWEHLDQCLKQMIKHQGWKQLKDRKGKFFESFTEFCGTARPEGLGRCEEEIKAIQDDRRQRQTAQELAKDKEVVPLFARGRPKEGEEKGNNVTFIRGNDASYLVRRLKRDAPDIAAALGRGEYRSARAAAIAAGIVKVPTAMQAAQKACRKLTPGERAAFRRWLDTFDEQG